jgi:hypothetical protein
MGLSRAPKGCPPVLHQPDSDQLSACLKKKPKQNAPKIKHSIVLQRLYYSFDAVQRAPYAKSLRLPCDRCHSRSDTNRSQEQINTSHPGPQKYTQPLAHPVCAPLLCAQKPLSCHLCLSPALLPSRRARQSAQEGRGARAAGTVLDKSIPQEFNGL